MPSLLNLFPIPPATPQMGLVIGGSSATLTANTPGVPLGPGGVPAPGPPPPQGTPVVTALPAAGDPLAVIGQYVIYQGKLYIYTLGIFAGPNYWKIDTTDAPSIRDTWANLGLYPAANYPLATSFLAIDRSVSYSVQETSPGVKTWIYYNGIYEAPIASLPVGLDDTSRDLVFEASDYLHFWKWDAGWTLTTGSLPPGTMLFANPGPPFGGFGNLWHLCDGATVDVSQNDATLVATVLPTIANTWFVR